MPSSDTSSDYVPSSHSSWSLTSTATGDSQATATPSPPASPTPAEMPKYSFPPLTLSALAAAATEEDPYALSNPFVAAAYANAWHAVNVDDANHTVLKGYIAAIGGPVSRYLPMSDDDDDGIDSSGILEAAIANPDTRRMVTERYAEQKVKERIEAMRDTPADFGPDQAEVDTLLLQAADTVEAGHGLAKVMLHKIDKYSFLSPKLSPYRTRKLAMAALVSLGEGVLSAAPALKAGIMAEPGVGIKLGLALNKLVKEITGRERGYLKRDGIAAKAKELVHNWQAEGDMGDTTWVDNI